MSSVETFERLQAPLLRPSASRDFHQDVWTRDSIAQQKFFDVLRELGLNLFFYDIEVFREGLLLGAVLCYYFDFKAWSPEENSFFLGQVRVDVYKSGDGKPDNTPFGLSLKTTLFMKPDEEF